MDPTGGWCPFEKEKCGRKGRRIQREDDVKSQGDTASEARNPEAGARLGEAWDSPPLAAQTGPADTVVSGSGLQNRERRPQDPVTVPVASGHSRWSPHKT